MPVKAQSIQIDSSFLTSCQIYPFENIELVSSLTIEGDIELNNDTSLVRVILEDENGFQYMVFEAYPLIYSENEFTVQDHCDETCALDMVNPASIIIQIIDAKLDLKGFEYDTEAKENSEAVRYTAKREKDIEKIEMMNQQIPYFGMNWTSGDNSIVESYYEQKSAMFGVGYNLLGYDYYTGGVFEFLGHRDYPKVDPDMVWHFDWRERHGANDPESPYWDGDDWGNGWLTGPKDQGPCGSCWAFSAVGAVEAMATGAGDQPGRGACGRVFLETITTPLFTEASEYYSPSPVKLVGDPQKNYMTVFPNPAKDYVIVYYDLDKEGTGYNILITNEMGEFSGKYLLETVENQVILDLRNIPNGVFFISLFRNGNHLETEKLIKIQY